MIHRLTKTHTALFILMYTVLVPGLQISLVSGCPGSVEVKLDDLASSRFCWGQVLAELAVTVHLSEYHLSRPAPVPNI